MMLSPNMLLKGRRSPGMVHSGHIAIPGNRRNIIIVELPRFYFVFRNFVKRVNLIINACEDPTIKSLNDHARGFVMKVNGVTVRICGYKIFILKANTMALVNLAVCQNSKC